MASEVASGFHGFRPELIEFLRDLGTTNTREWFQAHYDDYQTYLRRASAGI